MKRGELYLVHNPAGRDPKRNRAFVVVSRDALLRTNFPTVICAPVYSHHHGLMTQVRVGIDEGLKHESSIHCDDLVSVPRALLTNYIGELSPEKMNELNQALSAALGLEDEAPSEV